MKRWVIPALALALVVVGCLLSRTAVDPEDFSGQWYSSQDQSVYLFREGIIYCRKHSVSLSDEEYISGAYTYCGDSVFLFVTDMEGLEESRELYLRKNGEERLLCENKDGSGQIFFVRGK